MDMDMDGKVASLFLLLPAARLITANLDDTKASQHLTRFVLATSKSSVSISIHAFLLYFLQHTRVTVAKTLFPRNISFQSPLTRRNKTATVGSNNPTIGGSGGEEEEERRWDIIHPHSKIRSYWDMATLCMMVWVVIDVPFTSAFNVHDDQLVWDWHRVISFTVDLFFMVDVIVNFNTGVELDGKVSLDRRDIARDYMKSW